ncbi:uncharacterized protein LOC126842161 [Adelges cooleyi]|uniref:uncharacterized protein LOC126842161 n=1 Tax=Adelges cooleyi TaxID=133065 RepID=UPI00217FBB1E|nr:uncharacterized protein LOC126842161 [Adelges cooleyi]
MISLAIVLVCCVLQTTGIKPPTYFPNLPMGEYKLKFKAVFPCESTERHKLQYNTYLSKKSVNEFELKGNLTYFVPFDDSISININMASKGSIGGWKDNAHVYTTPNACSKMKFLFGDSWKVYVKGFNFSDTECPMKPGTYVATGIDVDKMTNTNFPKTFFYGEYKMAFTFTSSKGEKLGCTVLVLDILRPWEN